MHLVAVASGLAACSAHRQIARTLRCAKTSVTRMAERLGRHAVLFQSRCLERLAAGEVIVHDHFETFIGRQDRALGIGTAVGSASWFVYDVDPASHVGSGRRPERQGTAYKEPPRSPYVRSIKRTLSGLVARLATGECLTLVVDGRADYRHALRDPALSGRAVLRVFPNPERGPKGSPRRPDAIARDHAMFPVDQLHQLLRHSCAEHKRETIAFGRRLESTLGRANLMAVWKNFIKARSERAPDRSTPAMRLGLASAPWTWERILSRRLFLWREAPTESARKLYEKRWTAGLPELSARQAG